MLLKEDPYNLNPFETKNLYGLNNYFHNLIRLYKLNNLPNNMLFSGDKGIGKFTLCFHFINYLLSQKSNESYDLNNFKIIENNIYNLIVNNLCENFIYISNENKKKASIEDIRAIKQKLYSTTLNNLPRFIVIDDAELLNVNSVNSLLKLIEEPSFNNYFILINNNKKNIIETLKSRCVEIKFLLSKEELENIFNGLKNQFNIDENYTNKYLKFTTPGNLIKYSEILNSNKINAETSYYKACTILFERFKKSKNYIFIDCANFFLHIKFSKSFVNKQNHLNLINKKLKIMKSLYDFKNFNLTNNSVLEIIKKIEINAK